MNKIIIIHIKKTELIAKLAIVVYQTTHPSHRE